MYIIGLRERAAVCVRTILAALLLALVPLLASHAAEPARAARHMVAAANPHAARAGLGILRAGGSAADAAIAVQMVLNVVEPQSSGIGGGAFLLYYDAARREVRAYDGRETAPAAATEALFLDASGKPLHFWDAVVGGRSVGVPGVVAMLELAHKAHGRLAWRELFAPAIAIADDGFAIAPTARPSRSALGSPTRGSPTACARSRRTVAAPSTRATSRAISSALCAARPATREA